MKCSSSANTPHLLLMSGPRNLCEELRLQVSHPGDDAWFCRGGSGPVDHPEKQPSISPAWQSAQYYTGKIKQAHCTSGNRSTMENKLGCCLGVVALLDNLAFICISFQGVGRCIPQLTWPDRCGVCVWRSKKERSWVPRDRTGWLLTRTSPTEGTNTAGVLTFNNSGAACHLCRSFSFRGISVPLLTRLCLGTGLLSLLCLLWFFLPNLRSTHPRLLSSNWP